MFLRLNAELCGTARLVGRVGIPAHSSQTVAKSTRPEHATSPACGRGRGLSRGRGLPAQPPQQPNHEPTSQHKPNKTTALPHRTRRRRTSKFTTRRSLPFNRDNTLQEKRVAQAFGNLDLDIQSLAWSNQPSKFRVVQPCRHGNFTILNWNLLRDQNGGRLKAHLALQYAWQHGELRIVPLKDRQIFSDGRTRVNCGVGHLDNFIQP